MPLTDYLAQFTPPRPANTLVPRHDLVHDPRFWALHLWLPAPDVADAFDIDPDDLDAYATELLDEDRWPMITLDVAHGHRVHVIQRNLPGDGGTDFVLELAGGDLVRLAKLDGHFDGPGLCRSELVTAALIQDAEFTPAQRLLLLVPMLGDINLPASASNTVADALTSVGAVRDQRSVASDLVSGTLWASCAWFVEDGVRWFGGDDLRSRSRANPRRREITEAFTVG
ncbi:hypothetical protein GCM10029964_094590 [Kibdelosporangium lantanae]